MSRRTYPVFLSSLGTKASHLALIKKEAFGYADLIRNFDKLLDYLGIDEDAMLQEMLRMQTSVLMDRYEDGLVAFLLTGQKPGLKKAEIKALLRATENNGRFDATLDVISNSQN